MRKLFLGIMISGMLLTSGYTNASSESPQYIDKYHKNPEGYSNKYFLMSLGMKESNIGDGKKEIIFLRKKYNELLMKENLNYDGLFQQREDIKECLVDGGISTTIINPFKRDISF